MTKTQPTYPRATWRTRCGKCGAPGRWGEPCVLCGSVDVASNTHRERYDDSPKLRVGHGQICTAEGEPHKCHCQGGQTHPCNCYDSPA